MVIGEVFRHVRKEKGLSQTDLGTLIGLTTAQISRIESSKARPHKSTIMAFCELYKIPKTWIDLIVTEHKFDTLTVAGATHKRMHRAAVKLLLASI